jgi:hypothetical protein
MNEMDRSLLAIICVIAVMVAGLLRYGIRNSDKWSIGLGVFFAVCGFAIAMIRFLNVIG